MFLPLLSILLISILDPCHAATINAPNGLYSRWPTNVIPFKYMSSNANELNIIQAAADQISFDTGGCVNFTMLRNDLPANQPHIVIQSKFTNPTTASDLCFSYPGYVTNQGNNGQIAVMFSSTSGTNAAGACLDTVRDAMRILMNAIGIRNEYQRKDRDTFMVFPTGVVDRNSLVSPILQKYGIFAETNRYNDSVAINAIATFDQNSITMVSGARFAGTSTPVFNTVGNVNVGQQSRLSLFDCQTVRFIYSCSTWYNLGPNVGLTGCADPYGASNGLTFDISNNAPAVITRNLQCPLTGTSAPGTAVPLAQLLIRGLAFSIGTGAGARPAAPILTISPTTPGLTVEAVAVRTPVTLRTPLAVPINGQNDIFLCGEGSAPPTTETCGWMVRFAMNPPPTKGFLNKQITINVQQQNGAGLATIGSLSVTININCAPQFQSITANVGYSALMTTPITRTVGATPGIDYVSAPHSNAPPWVTSLTGITLAPYIVNYYMSTAFGETGIQVFTDNTGAPASAVGTPRKVFTNCQGGTTPNLMALSAVAQVVANDPEGGQITYYAYSGVAITQTAGLTAGPETHIVTKDGIVFIAPIANSPGAAGTEPVAFPPAAAGSAHPSDAANTLPNTGATSRDIDIVAVDAQGAYSVLQARFFFGCGVVQV